MQAYNKIKITSTSADITLLDDGSDTELYGECHIENGTLQVELNDDSTIVIPASHYEIIEISSSTGDCCVRLTRSTVDHIIAESITGDVEIDANTDNVSMASSTGSCVKRGRKCTSSASFRHNQITKISKDNVSVSSSDFTDSLEGKDN